MPAGISTTLEKLDFVSEANRVILRAFYEYMLSKDHKSEGNVINQLTLLISLDKFYDGMSFTSINSKEQVLTFLKYQYVQKEGKWVEREHDAEGRYITSFNQYLGLLRTFFRWLFNSYCKNRPDEDWETKGRVLSNVS
jgi:hypothetical protein